MTGRLIAVVGPSGVGKDSVMRALVAARPDMRLARRVVTRPSDAGGEDFDGVTPETFAQMEASGAFALNWFAHGLHYGIPATVRADLNAGHDVLANLSRGMLGRAQEVFPGMITLNLTAEREVLAQRLTARGRESIADIAARLERADQPLPAGISALTQDNSGPLSQTITNILSHLYPERA